MQNPANPGGEHESVKPRSCRRTQHHSGMSNDECHT